MDNQKKSILFALSAIVCWSTVASAFKLSLNHIHYTDLLIIAVSTALLFLLVVIISRNELNLLIRIKPKQIVLTALSGLINPFLYYLVLLKAYSLLRAQEAGTLNYIWPITLILLSIPLLKQKVEFRSILAILLSFTGILVISSEGDILSFQFREPLGIGLAVGSSFFWALYWILNIKIKCNTTIKLFYSFLFGGIYLLIYKLATGFNDISVPALFGGLYIGIFEMGLPFFLWLNALKLAKNNILISNLVYLSPFISLIIIRLTVGEKILVSTITGLILIIGGILLQQYYSNKTTSN